MRKCEKIGDGNLWNWYINVCGGGGDARGDNRVARTINPRNVMKQRRYGDVTRNQTKAADMGGSKIANCCDKSLPELNAGHVFTLTPKTRFSDKNKAC